MRVKREIYKGIEYVSLSNLPIDQKEKIATTFDRDKIIKILKDGVLLSDCIQYADYLAWFEEHFQAITIRPSHVPQATSEFKLSIK